MTAIRDETAPQTRPVRTRGRWPRGSGTATLVVGAVLVVVGQRWLVPRLTADVLQTWSTIFVAIVVQATPFLVGGVALAAAVSVLVPASFFQRALPRRPVLAVPVAGAAGFAIPGCECASVPVAASLVRRGVTPAAALAFLLSAPAINPIVLVSTYVAFPGQPEIVAARFVASLAVALAMGWLWLRLGRDELIRLPRRPAMEGASRWEQFRSAAMHDLVHAGGFLVLGGMVAATVNVLVPTEWISALAERPWLAVLALAVLAVIVAICSEADAFVAASFRELGTTAQLAFMVVGPAVDVKLISLQAGSFGRAFAARFAPTTFVVAVASAGLVGWWLL